MDRQIEVMRLEVTCEHRNTKVSKFCICIYFLFLLFSFYCDWISSLRNFEVLSVIKSYSLCLTKSLKRVSGKELRFPSIGIIMLTLLHMALRSYLCTRFLT